jgi:hypothetical protein
MSARFGTLRALLQEAPSGALWRSIIAELARWGEEERERVALPYALDHLDKWPPQLRRWAGGEDPAWQQRLANAGQGRSLVEDEARVARCRHLWIEGPACEEALAGHLHRFDQLLALTVRTVHLGEEAMLRVVSHAWPSSLRALSVEGLSHQREETRRRIVEALAGNASWAGLEGLELRQGDLDLASVEALAGSPHLSQLRALNLEGNALDVASARALAQSPHLRRLHTLGLSRCGMDAACARVLAGSPVLETVKVLDVSYNPLRAGLAALLGSPYTRGLTTITMDYVELDPAGARALCKVAWPPGLEGLDLNKVHCNRRASDALSGAPLLRIMKRFSWHGPKAEQPTGLMASAHLTGLRALELHNADEALVEAARSPALSGLETLSIHTQRLSVCSEALAQSVFRATLRSLSVSTWRVGVGALFEAGPWSALRHLKLRGRSHDKEGDELAEPARADEDIERLSRSETLRELEELDLAYYLLTDLAAKALADSGMLGSLRALNLSGNQIGDRGLIALIERGGMNKLESLLLNRAQIGDAGAAVIASDAVTQRLFCALVTRGLSENKIGLAGTQALLRSPHIGAVEELWLPSNALTHEDIAALAQDPALGDLRGTLKLSCRDAHEQTWQPLIDSPYASQGTRDYAARLAEELRLRAQRGQG